MNLLRPFFRGGLCLWLLAGGGLVQGAGEDAPDRRPVKAVGDQRLDVRTAAGHGALVRYASRPLGDGAVQADIERAVLVFHGRLRDAGVYWCSAQEARLAAAGVRVRHVVANPSPYLYFSAERPQGRRPASAPASINENAAGSGRRGPRRRSHAAVRVRTGGVVRRSAQRPGVQVGRPPADLRDR